MRSLCSALSNIYRDQNPPSLIISIHPTYLLCPLHSTSTPNPEPPTLEPHHTLLFSLLSTPIVLIGKNPLIHPNMSSLEVVGIARKPNKHDLKARGLTGLIDDAENPDVVRIRARLEKEQKGLRDIGVRESFVRIEGDGGGGKEVDGGEGKEGNAGMKSALRVDDEIGGKVEEEKGWSGSNDDVEKKSSLQANSVVGDDGSGKLGRCLRKRNPIQVRPYVLEREGYRRLVKNGRR